MTSAATESGLAERDRRWPRTLYGTGKEPDARFTMANERTFLAWIRTSLALVAAGVAVKALALPILPVLQVTASICFYLAGFVAPVLGLRRWYRTEKAMRADRPLPAATTSVAVLTILCVAAIASLYVGAILD